METTYIKLKKVPAISKQELLIYVAGQASPANLKITTAAGFVYNGLVVNIGNAKDDGAMLVLQTINEKTGISNSLLHMAVSNIESIEITVEQDAMGILSLGIIASNNACTVSGKLEVQRAFKTFADTVYTTSGVQTGAPEMGLPADGAEVNRVLKLTQTIQDMVIDVLKEEDARSSGQERYNKMIFANSDFLRITDERPAVNIHFAFNDINAAEISKNELTHKLMSVL
jgi:hypothetical protein